MNSELKHQLAEWLKNLQSSICSQLEIEDGGATFSKDEWKREEGGGGITRIIEKGKVFEKGGVAFSAVHGKTPEFLLSEKEHSISADEKTNSTFFATGVSIVIHPENPFVPIIHMNIRYFEMSNGVRWLGGGIDLTPHYINLEDAAFFHSSLKKVCDQSNPDYYPKFKKWADDYFFIKHRNETRGIGGIFFDRLSHSDDNEFNKLIQFWKQVGEAFAPTYLSLVRKNKATHYVENHKNWQLLRRGRYVEFNLVYDKGTKFGLETNGRIESILMSLPQHASWQYNFQATQHSPEEKTLQLLKKEIDFINHTNLV
jgi:coproporphyrinogen III oxidase